MITKFYSVDVCNSRARGAPCKHNHDHNSRWVEHVRPNWSLNTDMICVYGSKRMFWCLPNITNTHTHTRTSLSPPPRLSRVFHGYADRFTRREHRRVFHQPTHTQRVFIATLMYLRYCQSLARCFIRRSLRLCRQVFCFVSEPVADGCLQWWLNMRHRMLYTFGVCVCV